MIRQLFIVLFAIILVQQVEARSETEARVIAEEFFSSHNHSTQKTLQKVTILHKGENKQKILSTSDNYYVYTCGESDGFVIVSAFDENRPIIGYSFDTSFTTDRLPVQLEDILDNYTNPAQMPSHISSGEAVSPPTYDILESKLPI